MHYFYDIVDNDLARVRVGNEIVSLMDCKQYLTLYLQNHQGFESIGTEVPLEFEFVVVDNSLTHANVKTYEFKEKKINDDL